MYTVCNMHCNVEMCPGMTRGDAGKSAQFEIYSYKCFCEAESSSTTTFNSFRDNFTNLPTTNLQIKFQYRKCGQNILK